MNRRTLLSNAGLALAGLGMSALRAEDARARCRRDGHAAGAAAADGAAAAGARLLRPRHPRHRRPAAAPSVGLRAEGGAGSTPRPSSTTTATAAPACRCRGAPATMAADMALAHAERRAAVLGSGVVGLTTARQLQRRGFAVTIYAANVPPDVTSNFSLAAWTPTSGLVESAKRTPEWDAQLRAGRRDRLPAAAVHGLARATASRGSPTTRPTESARVGHAARTRCCRAHLQSEHDAAAAGRASVPDHATPSNGPSCASSRTSTCRRSWTTCSPSAASS